MSNSECTNGCEDCRQPYEPCLCGCHQCACGNPDAEGTHGTLCSITIAPPSSLEGEFDNEWIDPADKSGRTSKQRHVIGGPETKGEWEERLYRLQLKTQAENWTCDAGCGVDVDKIAAFIRSLLTKHQD